MKVKRTCNRLYKIILEGSKSNYLMSAIEESVDVALTSGPRKL